MDVVELDVTLNEFSGLQLHVMKLHILKYFKN